MFLLYFMLSILAVHCSVLYCTLDFTKDQIRQWMGALQDISYQAEQKRIDHRIVTKDIRSDSAMGFGTITIGEFLKRYPLYEDKKIIGAFFQFSLYRRDGGRVRRLLHQATKALQKEIPKRIKRDIEYIKRENQEIKKKKEIFFRKAQNFSATDNLYIFGDLHGGVHTVWSIFEPVINDNLEIIDKNNHYIFLGDITDSGLYSFETLMLLLIIYLNNQNNVHIVRGNHENSRENSKYGFWKELKVKFPAQHAALKERIQSLYESLPSIFFAVFPTTGLIKIFCHGMVDRKDENEVKLMLEEFSLDPEQKSPHYTYGTFYETCAYNWNDCRIYPGITTNIPGTRDAITQSDTEQWIKNVLPSGYRGEIYRAHQHSYDFFDQLMPCFFLNDYIALLWDMNSPTVFTLPYSPDSAGKIAWKEDSQGIFFPGILRLTNIEMQKGGTIVKVITHPNRGSSDSNIENHYNFLLANLKLFIKNYQILSRFVDGKNLNIDITIQDYYEFKAGTREWNTLYQQPDSFGRHLLNLFKPDQNDKYLLKTKEDGLHEAEENMSLFVAKVLAKNTKEFRSYSLYELMSSLMSIILREVEPYWTTLTLKWHERVWNKLQKQGVQSDEDITIETVKDLFSIEKDGMIALYAHNGDTLELVSADPDELKNQEFWEEKLKTIKENSVQISNQLQKERLKAQEDHRAAQEEHRAMMRRRYVIVGSLGALSGVFGYLMYKKGIRFNIRSVTPFFSNIFHRFFSKKIQLKGTE